MSDTYTKTIATYLFLDLTWEVLSQDIPNNRSRVRLTLKLRHTGTGIWFSAPKSGVLQGSSFTYTGGFSGTGTKTLQRRDIWVNHNSNGSKTQTFSASFNPAITYQGSGLGNQTVSGSATLPTIPRSSEVTAFSMGAALKTSTSNTVSVRLNVYSSAFRFDVSLRYGSKSIASWNNQSFTNNTSKSLALSTSEVNDLLSEMKNTSSGTVNIRVQTKSGSGGSKIGSVQSRNATASVHADVKPTATGLSVEIDGTGRDSARSKYIQNISRVKTSFNASATGGATVSSRSIVVRQNTSKGNSMTINSDSGTTGVVTQSGTYEAVASVRDSRGRTATQRTTFTVHAYSPPAITTFTADRNTAAPTTVNISRAGRFTPLGTGDNTLTILIQKSADNGSTWTNFPSTSTTSSTFSGTLDSLENSVTSSYQFRITISDSFNNSAEASATVSTQRVVLDIHKNEGVGIGKIHEDGVLDVDGRAYFAGDLFVNNANISRLTGFSEASGLPTPVEDTITYWQTLPQGSYFVGSGHIPNQPSSYGIMVHTTQNFGAGSDFNTMWYSQSSGAVYRKSGNRSTNTDWILIDRPERGSNENGQWVRFLDGTQICTYSGTLYFNAGYRVRDSWTFPKSFSSSPSVSFNTGSNNNMSTGAGNFSGAQVTPISTSGATLYQNVSDNSVVSGDRLPYTAIAIGRWK